VNAESAQPPPARDREWYLSHLGTDATRFEAAVRGGDLAAPVDACPGWDLRALTSHVGMVHRWAQRCAATAQPQRDFEAFAPPPDLDNDALADWLLDGVDRLVATLRQIDLDGPTWHPFPVARIGRVWPRRQAHEISIHRWDAERGAGLPSSAIDPELASDGIDEYFELVVPRLVKREGVVIPVASLHVHCTDTQGEWLVHVDDDGYHLERAHAKGAAALRGPAEAILLRLWNRSSGREQELSPVGDQSALDAWLTLTGL
jgi:uncharacterized protein (TIGR03083 family)